MITRSAAANTSPKEDEKIQLHEETDCVSNLSGSLSTLKTWLQLLKRALCTRRSKPLSISVVIYAHSLAAYGSPIQAREGILMDERLHQSLRRDGTNNGRIGAAVPLGVSVALVLLILLGCIKGNMARRRRNLETDRSSVPQELTAGQLAVSANNQSTDNRGQSAPGVGRARQGRQRNPELPMHPLPVYAKEPGECEQIILPEMGVLPCNRRLDNVAEEGGSSTGDPGHSRRPSYSVTVNPPRENNGADNSSYPNPPDNFHIPSESRHGTTAAETVDNHNSATSNLRGDAPPPYVEVAGQRPINDR